MTSMVNARVRWAAWLGIGLAAGCYELPIEPPKDGPVDSADSGGAGGGNFLDPVEDGVFALHLVSGSSGVDEASLGDLTLAIDLAAAEAVFTLDDGTEVVAAMAPLAEDAWDTCCWTNGDEHTVFETFALSPSPLVLGPATIEAPVLSGEPSVMDTDPASGLYGNVVRLQFRPAQ